MYFLCRHGPWLSSLALGVLLTKCSYDELNKTQGGYAGVLNRSYDLELTWRVPGKAEEVYDILMDVEALPKWWPANFLDVSLITRSDEAGVGRMAAFRTTGLLPIVQHWQAEVVEARRPEALHIRVTGDFEGEGQWRFAQRGEMVEATFRWSVRIEKPVIRWLAAVLKPLFALDHNWAMDKGEQSLRLELARRHAVASGDSSSIPAPPQPAKLSLPLILAALSLPAIFLASRMKRKRSL